MEKIKPKKITTLLDRLGVEHKQVEEDLCIYPDNYDPHLGNYVVLGKFGDENSHYRYTSFSLSEDFDDAPKDLKSLEQILVEFKATGHLRGHSF